MKPCRTTGDGTVSWAWVEGESLGPLLGDEGLQDAGGEQAGDSARHTASPGIEGAMQFCGTPPAWAPTARARGTHLCPVPRAPVHPPDSALPRWGRSAPCG